MKLTLIILALISTQIIGCASVGSRAGSGMLYTDVKDFTDVSYINTKFSKTGKACATNILGLFLTGDMSLATAKKNGEIKRVATVDYEGKSILGLYSTVCLVATGY